jgi:farnesyl-diphosphate farnesyltransferase
MAQRRRIENFDDRLEWCYDAVEDVSRTFAITIAELNEPMARDICVGYLLCRVADTVEDAGHVPPAAQSELLETYHDALAPETDTDIEQFRANVEEWIPDEPDDDWQVVEKAPRVVRTFRGLDEHARECIRPPVLALVDGMRLFVERYAQVGGLRIDTVEELEEYCWYAAGTVGTMITDLVSQDAPPAIAETLEDNARSFALLLQLVNVAKDVASDYTEENNVYLPAELLRKEGITAETITDPENVDAVAAVVDEVTGRAESYLDDAQEWLEAMPETRGNTLSAWAIPYLLAVGTIRELRKRPEEVIENSGVKVPRQEVHTLLGVFTEDVEAASIGELRRKISQRPLHEYGSY